jgi:hypothetical protein
VRGSSSSSCEISDDGVSNGGSVPNDAGCAWTWDSGRVLCASMNGSDGALARFANGFVGMVLESIVAPPADC